MKILNSVEGFNLRGENHNALFYLYQCIAALKKAKKQPGAKARDSSNPWYGAPLISAGKFGTAALNEFVEDVLRPKPEDTVIGFKEIRHKKSDIDDTQFAGYVAFILKNFPKSRIVLLTRDAEKISASAWYQKLPKEDVIADIQATDRRFSDACEKHKSCFLIDHSDITANGARLGELFGFLGVTHDTEKVNEVLSVPLTHLKAGRLPKKPVQLMLRHLGIRPSAK